MLKHAMLACVLINGIIFAQNHSKTLVNIKARLIEGTAISIIDHKLQPEQFSKIAYPQLSNYNSDGIFVHISGYKNNVMVGYRYFNFSEFDSIKANRFEQMIGTHSTLQYINDQGNCLFIYEPFPDSESMTKEKSHNKICYISLVYN